MDLPLIWGELPGMYALHHFIARLALELFHSFFSDHYSLAAILKLLDLTFGPEDGHVRLLHAFSGGESARPNHDMVVHDCVY